MRIFLLFFLIIITNVLTAQINFQSSNLPIISINTNNSAIVDEPRIVADMGIIYNGENVRNNITDPFNEYDGKIAIELRGQTSQFLFDKKSYRLETQDDMGEDINVSLLGMPKENDWILYGPYSDKTLIRNTFIYNLSNKIGQYAVRTQYIELVINGDYKGIYVLMEKIKRDKNRVDIAKMSADDIAGDAKTGGYIIRLDKVDEGDKGLWESAYSENPVRILYQVVYPKPDAIPTPQFFYIRDFMEEFETALRSENYQDADVGFRKYIDVPSFVDYLLLNELGRNPDGYRISTYLHKERDSDGGKLKMGPIWDFNIAMGNANFCLGSSHEGWALNYNSICPDDWWLMPYWWDLLLTDEGFSDAVISRWKTLRQSTLSNFAIEQTIDSLVDVVSEAQVRNFQQWNVLNEWVWPNDYIGGDYENEIAHFKDWVQKRLIWMDQHIDGISSSIRSEDFSTTKINISPNPFTDVLTIDLQKEQALPLELVLYNSLGQIIERIELEQRIGIRKKIILDDPRIKRLKSGLYFYKLFLNGKKGAVGKLLKSGY